MNIGGGQRAFIRDGYITLAKRFMLIDQAGSEGGNASNFGWAYIVLMWNLMCHADSMETIMLEHIEWQDDSLVIRQHRTDQAGETSIDKHLYANPFDPVVCPVLSLAVLVFCSPRRIQSERQQLFMIPNCTVEFSRLLRTLVHNLTEEELQWLGCEPDDVATDCIRYGARNYALGQPGGPSLS